MALGPKLTLRQSQSLVMTPQLQQAIKLLQMSNSDLAQYIEQELERNPLLERDDAPNENPISYSAGGIVQPGDAPATVPEAGTGAAEPAAETLSEAHSATNDSADLEIGSSAIESMDGMWGGSDSADIEVGSSVAFENWGSGGSHSFDGDYDFESQLVSETSLREHLISQINVTFTADDSDSAIAMQMLEMLDEAGYLSGDLDRLSALVGCRRSRIDRVLSRLQRLDPAGIFARDLPECLAIQLAETGEYDEPYDIILENLSLLAAGDWPRLQRLAGIDEEELRRRVSIIKTLQPKPATVFDNTRTQTVTPDVLVRPAPSGGWIIELNAENLPRVLVNNSYFNRLGPGGIEKIPSQKDKDYLTEQMQSANWLVKALHQRATTILKVATSIVQTQEDFFLRGVEHLRPLVLRDIAERVGIHESTVSRVTNNKFMQTPRGMYELKYFFSAAIQSSDGAAAHSAESVRHRIKALIDAETRDKVLSDDNIVQILKDDGVDIARRTVAKYREALRIPSSVQRRRMKAMAG